MINKIKALIEQFTHLEIKGFSKNFKNQNFQYSSNKTVSLKKELLRKAHHLLIAILPISYFFFSKTEILYFLIPICSAIILVDYYRHRIAIIGKIFNLMFSKILREHEKRELCSASYFSIAALIIFILFPKTIAISAFLILTISDSLATIIGRKISSKAFFEKSAAGSATFFISASLIVISLGLIFEETILYYPFSLMAVFATTIIEARPSLLRLDDNLTIPLSFSLILIAFNTLWVYN